MEASSTSEASSTGRRELDLAASGPTMAPIDEVPARPEPRWNARARRIAWALALLLTVLALVQALHKARKGQSALLKWRPQVEALFRGESIYGREDGGTREGFPTPPTTAIGL